MRNSIVVTSVVGVLAGAAMLDGPRVRAQAPPAQADSSTFEVASVKPNKSGDGFVQLGGRGGQYTMTNAPLRLIIRNAYRLQDFQIVGGPSWLNSDRFDIVAKSDPTAHAGPDAGDGQSAARGSLQAEGAYRKPRAAAICAGPGEERRQARAADQDGSGRLPGAGGGPARRPTAGRRRTRRP